MRSPLPKLVLFSAPAGFGKTTLALDWLRQASVPYAWLSLDLHDNEPAHFAAHLVAALRTLDPMANLRDAEPRPELQPRSPDQLRVQPSPERVVADAAAGVIVLDDYHNIDAPAVHEMVRELLESLGSEVHLLILTRVDPPLPLGRLRVSGDLLELREEELRFTRDEASAFFRLTLADELPAHLVDTLEERTEGWAAGLRMAALALQGAVDPEIVVTSFTGKHHFVMDYLLEEALARQSDAVQRFLMQTSILSRFDAELCAAVTADPEASRLLETVEAANLFLVRLDGEHRWFRYHHLFAELLEFRLRRLHPELIDVLHERASAWFDSRGEVQEALRHASRITAPERFLALLDRCAMEMIRRSELATFERWMRYVPDPESLRHPMLLTAFAWFRLLSERIPALERLLAATDAAVANPAVPYPAARKEEVQLLHAALRAYQLRFQNRPAEAVEASQAVLKRLTDSHCLVRGVLLFNQARAQMQLGEMRSTHAVLQRSLEANLAAGTHYLVLASLGHTGAVLLQTDGVPRARRALETALDMARERGIETLPACGIILYQLGRVFYLADELDLAHGVLNRAVELGRTGHEPEILFNGLLQLARVDAARGDFAAARSQLEVAELIGQAHNTSPFDTTLEVERARFALLSGDPQGAEDLCRDFESWSATGEHPWTPVWEAEARVIVQIATLLGDADRAGVLAVRLGQEAEVRGRGVALCDAAIAQALLQPRGAAQQELLDQALRTSARRGYVRPWVDWGEPVRALLHRALEHPLSAEAGAYARRLLGGGAIRPPADSRPIPRYRQSLPIPLTDREQEVLHHLARGLSNKAIARRMSVSSETIKTHLKHVFAKLGAANRKDALSLAGVAGLLDPLELV